ncbi:hypothetical protein CcaverHIS002_0601220 [Cutaneotrichosporon cavernicola]|uniref:Uncharacterized protein n=1 Tax=Cutaneotrichosporon cavernicola TaxID=279322 RepID=A0AA48QWI6_9TREE|nr:uncharacterized protein CcaverHIS019_0501320 [Cutaneotrichosporon cavernicola]BEI85835.1 hypothetical protein CcaverHIS002_0601220 [Cutaneotrichosporon cavernicola]BEI92504.1 hypothetical protein CcaverHIS019_0501320 [Cutaneotrichosporon cavernicola]BEJ00276.1 hypothetical protein CcaverHIS631_0501330 [Cutaneotrichosporon cavernicola]BEJ08046.1 hypothetical protein CcaverHIS641_0501310 [Cutaneotrichosporon cavernicola]
MRWAFWRSADEPGPSTPTPIEEVMEVPTLTRFERTLVDEEKVQAPQYPTFQDVPTCMTLFDQFFMCAALMPQVRAIYRFGHLKDCTPKWDDFKYCMSLKSEDEEERRQAWIKRRAEWWAHRRVGPSSEDVWEVREKPLENFPPLYPEYDLDESQDAAGTV